MHMSSTPRLPPPISNVLAPMQALQIDVMPNIDAASPQLIIPIAIRMLIRRSERSQLLGGRKRVALVADVELVRGGAIRGIVFLPRLWDMGGCEAGDGGEGCGQYAAKEIKVAPVQVCNEFICGYPRMSLSCRGGEEGRGID